MSIVKLTTQENADIYVNPRNVIFFRQIPIDIPTKTEIALAAGVQPVGFVVYGSAEEISAKLEGKDVVSSSLVV